jgi:hypothetical protein
MGDVMYDLRDVYSRHGLDRRSMDPLYDDRHLDRFVRQAWRWVIGAIVLMILGGLLDAVGLIA